MSSQNIKKFWESLESNQTTKSQSPEFRPGKLRLSSWKNKMNHSSPSPVQSNPRPGPASAVKSRPNPAACLPALSQCGPLLLHPGRTRHAHTRPPVSLSGDHGRNTSPSRGPVKTLVASPVFLDQAPAAASQEFVSNSRVSCGRQQNLQPSVVTPQLLQRKVSLRSGGSPVLKQETARPVQSTCNRSASGSDADIYSPNQSLEISKYLETPEQHSSPILQSRSRIPVEKGGDVKKCEDFDENPKVEENYIDLSVGQLVIQLRTEFEMKFTKLEACLSEERKKRIVLEQEIKELRLRVFN